MVKSISFVYVADPPKETLEGLNYLDDIVDKPFPGDDEQLFHDIGLQKWFRTSEGIVRTALRLINEKVSNEGFATAADFYYYLGIPCPSFFNNLRWDKVLDISSRNSHLTNKDGSEGESVVNLLYTITPSFYVL